MVILTINYIYITFIIISKTYGHYVYKLWYGEAYTNEESFHPLFSYNFIRSYLELNQSDMERIRRVIN